MSLPDRIVAELYNLDRVIGEEPKSRGEEDFLRIENPYSLSDEGPESMFKQAGGGRRRKHRRSRRVNRRTRRRRY